MSRAEDAVMRLYESANLRDELTDEEADHLLKWAEGEVVNLDQAAADDSVFEAQVAALLKLLKGVNRFAGRQGQMSAQADDPLPAAIAEQAAALGRAVTPEQIAASGMGDPVSTITAITGLLSAKPDAAPAESPPESTDEPHFGDTDL